MMFNLMLVVFASALLWKTASWFVEGAVGVALLLDVPKMLIGLVLVSIATTSPELFTSVIAALHGFPEIALGNALGSIIVDASLALGLAALISSLPLTVDPAIFRISARTVLLVLAFGFFLVWDGTLGRHEGTALLGCYGVYILILYLHFRRRRRGHDVPEMLAQEGVHVSVTSVKWSGVILRFGVGLIGVLLGSEMLVRGAVGLAEGFGMPPVVLGLIVTALGTSMPEIATCIAAALKRESSIGVGNIIGADILNMCWVAGLSSMVHPLTAERHLLMFMFPTALVIVAAMVLMLRQGYQLRRWNGAVLVFLYVVYILLLFLWVSPINIQGMG